VILHGDPVPYAAPVIGNVVPDHRNVPSMVAQWATRLARNTGEPVPIVAMRPETTGVSLRGERIDAVRIGLESTGFGTELVEVPDYMGANAADVLRLWPSAPGYVCLSDAIAVHVVQLLSAAGPDARERVLGFDDSVLASRYRISSINQHLPDAAERVFDLLDSFFEHGPRQFQILRVPLTFSLRPPLE
jgi:DNA-binding LacI/PurR family transcriptional regulator